MLEYENVTTSPQQAGKQDPETPESVLTRFGIVTLEEDFTDFTVVASMPVGGMLNPFTGMPTIGRAGRPGRRRRRPGQLPPARFGAVDGVQRADASR